MTELEADDALASAAHLASADKHVQRVTIWTPDKIWRNASATRVWCRSTAGAKSSAMPLGIREKFGVDPPLIPDLLALVGDAADGCPGIAGFGAKTAARLLNLHGPIENFPPNVLRQERDLALLFKKLATLRTDARLFKTVNTLRWRGAVRLRPLRRGRSEWRRRGCWNGAKRLRAADHAQSDGCDVRRRPQSSIVVKIGRTAVRCMRLIRCFLSTSV